MSPRGPAVRLLGEEGAFPPGVDWRPVAEALAGWGV